ncbi:hypothetical protein EON63_05935 [archaeon]|nr:MAG: hypothetical protein EON63_05935 [archaeon]
MHSDIPWAPYANSEYDPTTYGYVAGLTSNFNNLPELVHNLTHITDEEYNKKLAKLREVQYAFTYEGMWYEIELFLHDPFGPHGGHLTCTKHPRTERCCD